MSIKLEVLSPSEMLGLTIYGEARGEPIEGQIGVGCVIRNRLVNNKAKYKTITDVVLEKLQFSCWNQTDPNRKILEEFGQRLVMGGEVDLFLSQAIYLATGLLSNILLDNTKGCQYYMTKRLFEFDRPVWAKNAKNEVTLGNQVFFHVENSVN